MDPVSLFTFQSSSITGGHCLKIFKPLATCLPQCHFFSLRVTLMIIIIDWNGLSEGTATVNADSIDLFRTCLYRFYYNHQYNLWHCISEFCTFKSGLIYIAFCLLTCIPNTNNNIM